MLKARVKRYVFKLDLKLARVVEDLIWSGRGFHRFGPATENARSPLVLRRVRGTDRSCLVDDRVDLGVECRESISAI